MMCIVVNGAIFRLRDTQALHLVMSFLGILQFKGIMIIRAKRTLQKMSIRRQICTNMLEHLICQSRTQDIERSSVITVMMLALSCLGEVYASIKCGEGKDNAYDRFRNHLGGE